MKLWGGSIFFFVCGGGRNLKQNAANVWVVVGLKYFFHVHPEHLGKMNSF